MIEWVATTEGLQPRIHGSNKKVVWAPQPGSQTAFLDCDIFEVLYEGTRGPGKTDALLMKFGKHVGRGFGSDWTGIIFRRTFPELKDIIAKSKKWFPQIWSQARYNESDHTWKWPTGEVLIFSYIERPADYYRYHGHAYPFIGFEELTTWPDATVYKMMFSCSRSTNPRIPIQVCSTTNPYGVGHNWVKARFRLPGPPGRIIGRVVRTPGAPTRVSIRGTLAENKILLFAQPDYIEKLRAAARNKNEEKAWIHGDWDIVAGGMFDDVWEPAIHVVGNVPFNFIPTSWILDRAYDDGMTKPFSVGWYAESSGEPFVFNGHVYGPVPGDLYRAQEWYGWTGNENEGLKMSVSDIAAGIVEREEEWGISGRVKDGPADSAIFTEYEPDTSRAGIFEKEGIFWEAADKRPNSRVQGWSYLREMLTNAKPREGIREKPGLFVFAQCEQFMRTFPVLSRDLVKVDDVDTKAEDHIGDEVRYRARFQRPVSHSRNF